MTGDVLDVFLGEICRTRGRIRRLTLVSPWLTHSNDEDAVGRLVRRAEGDGASVVLVTRTAAGPAHAAAIARVAQLRRGSVRLNDRLHAKLYVCEEARGRGFALVGSANLTAGSAALDEAAVLVRPHRGSNIISQLAPAAAQLGRRGQAGRSAAAPTSGGRTATCRT